jgi:hypothetical protein
MKWSDPQDRADRRLRNGIRAAAIIALLLPVWWNIVGTAWAAILLRASAQAFAQVIQAPPPAPYSVPRRASTPPHAPPSIRVLGATSAGNTVSVLVDLVGTMPDESRDKICRDGGAFIARSLSGSSVRVLRSRGTQPAVDAGTLVCT